MKWDATKQLLRDSEKLINEQLKGAAGEDPESKHIGPIARWTLAGAMSLVIAAATPVMMVVSAACDLSEARDKTKAKKNAGSE